MNETDVENVTSRKEYLKWLFRTTFRREKQFPNGSIMIEYWSSHIRIKKTKSSFHNKCVNVTYGDQAKIFLTDTDSFQNIIETKNAHEDF